MPKYRMGGQVRYISKKALKWSINSAQTNATGKVVFQATLPNGRLTFITSQDDEVQDDDTTNVTTITTNTNPTTTTATSANTTATSGQYVTMTDAMASQIRQQNDALYTPNARTAIKGYISAQQESNGYSMSQNLNYKLANGMKLNANEAYMDKYLATALHDLGVNTTMYRACHSDIFKEFGIKDYTKLSDSQLNSAMTGQEFTVKGYSSMSYDKARNPFISGNQAGGREVYMNIKVPANTKVFFGAKKQAEIVGEKGLKYRILGAHYDRTTALPRVGGQLPRVVIDVEIVKG